MKERRNLKASTVRARDLRAASSDPERRLWALLRDRRLGGAKFRRQVPIGPYFADFACLEARLVVEADGGQHAQSEAYDARRTAAMEALGWRVVRVGNNDILRAPEGVADLILAELSAAPRRLG